MFMSVIGLDRITVRFDKLLNTDFLYSRNMAVIIKVFALENKMNAKKYSSTKRCYFTICGMVLNHCAIYFSILKF